MPAPTEKLRVIRFGVFEVDLQEAELRKHGLRIKLQDQPFQILRMLLEHPGQTVSRDDLRQELWPADTFVDFDHSLNSSIKKLREALGDDSENPRFIETLHRRGYRFVSPVESSPSVLYQTNKSRATTVVPFSRFFLAAIALLTVLCVTYWLAHRQLPPPRVIATQITNDGRSKFLAVESANYPLVADSSRVYFQEAGPNGIGIAQVSITGGETALISANGTLMDISPIRSELLVGSGGDPEQRIEVQPLPAGSPHRLGDLKGHDAAWSLDGRSIVYANARSVYVANTDGTQNRQIVRAAGAVFWPRWSPEGARIRFTVRDATTGVNALWEVKRDGTRLRRLLLADDSSDECCGNWTPNGEFFFFQSSKNGKTRICVLRERRASLRRTGGPVVLTAGGMNYYAPIASRDGKQIFVKGGIPRGELVRYDRRSGLFVPFLAGISADGLDFSRDGEWVTYVAYPEGGLWRSRIDGTERFRLADSSMQVFLPRWSPDGSKISFAAKLPGYRWKVYVIPAEGGRPERITSGEGDEGDVSWSADGTSLAFGEMGFGPQSRATRFIQILDLKSGQVSKVPGSEGLYSPRWSPNGRYLAAMPVEQNKLMIYDFNTRTWAGWPIANPGFPSWSRDGSYIYFDSVSSTETVFVRMRITDGKLEQIAELKNVQRAGGLFGPWSGLTPDDSPLVLRDNGSEEIYALEWQEP